MSKISDSMKERIQILKQVKEAKQKIKRIPSMLGKENFILLQPCYYYYFEYSRYPIKRLWLNIHKRNAISPNNMTS